MRSFIAWQKWLRKLFPTHKTNRKAFRFFRPAVELLEDRDLPSTFFVLNTNDSGLGSFRQAILDSNRLPNPNFGQTNVIRFHIPGAGPHTIKPLSSLPAITDGVIIDGTSQLGYRGIPLIQITGSKAGNAGTDGLDLNATDITVIGLAFDGFSGAGIGVFGSANTLIANAVGTDPFDKNAKGNAVGIEILNSPDNEIRDNLVSGNKGDGVAIAGLLSTNNLVINNLIGTDITGIRALSNGLGFEITGARDNTLENNLISGNKGNGIQISGSGATGNIVTGNQIGTDISGTFGIGNGADGILVAAAGNTIGQGNLISGNKGNGIDIVGSSAASNVVQGNKIGTDKSGRTAIGNRGNGVLVQEGASANVIGGNLGTSGNLISGNKGNGVSIVGSGADNNQIEGNLIGTDGSGRRGLGNAGDGVLIAAGSDEVVGDQGCQGNVISANKGNGIHIAGPGAQGNFIRGNEIGTDVSGQKAIGNRGSGILLQNGVSGTIVGGVQGLGNLVSGNRGDGVQIAGAGTSGNAVEGNEIGTNSAGKAALANSGNGIVIDAASNNVIGGVYGQTGNLISGNKSNGVSIVGLTAHNNRVVGNRIGTDTSGEAALANGRDGVSIDDASQTVVGGPIGAQSNVISGNKADGVGIEGAGATNDVVEGNLIGTDAAGARRLGNQGDGVSVSKGVSLAVIGGDISSFRNTISANKGDGIRIANANAIRVQGNVIGADFKATIFLGNGSSGISLEDSEGDTIGGEAGATGNTIVGNKGNGIAVSTGGTVVILGNLIQRNMKTGVAISDSADNLVGNTGLNQGNFIASNGKDGLNIKGSLSSGNQVVGNTISANTASGISILAGAADTKVGGTESGAGNTITSNLKDGIKVSGTAGGATTNTTIQGNSIGTNSNGQTKLGNAANGVVVGNFVTEITIGGDLEGAGNTIAGNKRNGIAISGASTTNVSIQGNRIGTDPSAARALGNIGDGIAVSSGASNVIIGGEVDAAGNVISANKGDGVRITGKGTTGALVQGNKIGTDAAGSVALGNQGNGVSIRDGASANTIGPDNVVSGNVGDGILITGSATTANIVQGSMIGTDGSGDVALGNNNGVAIMGGAFGNTVGPSNLISGNKHAGVLIEGKGTANNQVQGNKIGTNAGGTEAIPNVVGVQISGGATDNIIGVTANLPGQPNTISGNSQYGVLITGSETAGNSVLGNLIGTDMTGAAAVGNATGVALIDAPGNQVAGGNVISGNAADGVLIRGKDATGNLIQGNNIGTDLAGTSKLADGRNGIFIDGASGNTVGVSANGGGGLGNIIAFNGNDGVQVNKGTGNLISQDSFFSNGNLAIELTNNGNHAQPAPVLNSVVDNAGNQTITLSLNAAPGTIYTIEFFSNPMDQPSCQGRTFLGTMIVTTDGNGQVVNAPVSVQAPVGQFLSATATNSEKKDTSQFSNCVKVMPPQHVPLCVDAGDAPPAPITPGPWILYSGDGITGTYLWPGTPPFFDLSQIQASAEAINSDPNSPYQWDVSFDTDLQLPSIRYRAVCVMS